MLYQKVNVTTKFFWFKPNAKACSKNPKTNAHERGSQRPRVELQDTKTTRATVQVREPFQEEATRQQLRNHKSTTWSSYKKLDHNSNSIFNPITKNLLSILMFGWEIYCYYLFWYGLLDRSTLGWRQIRRTKNAPEKEQNQHQSLCIFRMNEDGRGKWPHLSSKQSKRKH